MAGSAHAPEAAKVSDKTVARTRLIGCILSSLSVVFGPPSRGSGRIFKAASRKAQIAVAIEYRKRAPEAREHPGLEKRPAAKPIRGGAACVHPAIFKPQRSQINARSDSCHRTK